VIRPRTLAPCVAAAAACAAPVLAGAAPVISVQAPCVRPGQLPSGRLVATPLLVRGVGFGAGAQVRIARGARSDVGVAGADGTLTAPLSALDLETGPPRVTRVTVVAEDRGGLGGSPPPLGPSNAVRVAAAPFTFTATPRRASPSQPVRLRFSGFTPGRMLWAHYRYGGRLRATVPLGRTSGPCGLLSVRRPQIPVAHPARGIWHVQFDHRRRFSPRSRPRLRGSVDVYAASR
jgi:hypothetical protein